MAQKKISQNRARMQAYAKGGGLNGFRNGGSVLDKKSIGGIAKALKPVIKKVKTKNKKYFNIKFHNQNESKMR